jgi:hypothetical protein
MSDRARHALIAALVLLACIGAFIGAALFYVDQAEQTRGFMDRG